ncbi:GvpL/GvpF family gas vesicle protein [Geodermatophilus sp. SYSU D00703]
MTAPEADRLAALARELAPDVLARAVEKAREQAVARLADLLTDTLVAQALAGAALPGPPPPPAPAQEPTAPEPAAQEEGTAPEQPAQEHAARERATVFYAYALARADLPPVDLVPVTGGRVDRVTAGDLALLVSPVRAEQLRVDEDDLSEEGRLAVLARGHDAVIRAAAAAGPVLPLRFGTVVQDEDGARRLLDAHGAAARRLLARIADAREWGVRLLRTLEPEPALTRSRGDDERASATGTEYLARRREALAQRDEAERAAAQAAERLDEVLVPHVREAMRRGGSTGSSLLLDAAYLVTPDREEAFRAAVAGLAEELRPEGLDVEVTGPWPPYSFAALEESTGGRDGA